MADCPFCGAYVPDGEIVCPACGKDTYNKPAPNAPYVNEPPKAAEKKKTSTSERKGETPTAEKPVSQEAKAGQSKLFSCLVYVSILCFLPFIVCPDDDFARYHGRQGIMLFIVSAIIGVISKLSGSAIVAIVLELFRLYLVFKGVMNAYSGRKEPLPYIGKYAEKT